MGYKVLLVAVVALMAVEFYGGYLFHSSSPKNVETIYVVNHAGQYISDSQIRKDIPAWESAANRDFSPYWHTAQVRIELVTSAPAGSFSALFVKNGPIRGALAYHTVTRGVPQIVVYAGVADFYGYSNSVSFTHELFETLADPSISMTNQGYPYPDVCLVGSACAPQLPGTVWFNEVCDPVEADVYAINGVPISDFVTPNWFNDETRGPVDFMNILERPFLVDRGGYAQFWDGTSWQAVVNFRHAGRDAHGFLKG